MSLKKQYKKMRFLVSSKSPEIPLVLVKAKQKILLTMQDNKLHKCKVN